MESDPNLAAPVVLIVAESGGAGGIGRYCVDLAGVLGDQARLVCLCSEPCTRANECWLTRQSATRGVPLLKAPMPARGLRVGLARISRIWRHLGRPLVHVNGRRGNTIALAARLTLPDLRYVTTMHGVLALHSRRNALYRLVDLAASRLASAVIVVSADTGRYVTRARIPIARTYLIPNALAGMELDALRSVADRKWTARANGGPIRIGYLGRLSPEKGSRALLEVCRTLWLEGASATVAISGDGPDRDWLVDRARPMVESGFMSFRGIVDDAATSLAGIDVLVIPSQSEGMPYVLLEGMAAGCAIVAFSVGGIPEVVCDPTLGVLVRPGDTHELLASLRRLIETPALAAAYGMAAAEHISAYYCLVDRLPLISEAYGRAVGPPPVVRVQEARGPDK